MATLHLADMGADVVKIEDTGAGDYAREIGPMHEGTAVFFRLVNRNKRGMRLDLKNPKGREVFLRLSKKADVVVEGFRPGVMKKLALDYEAVAKINPRIVYCSISGYGQDGPYAQRAGHDINYIGCAGVGDQIGTAEAPVVPNFQIADLLGGALTPVMGILAALIDARGTGMLDGGLPCYNIYRTRDGRWMAVGALERKFWETLCDILGCADLKGKHIVHGEEARPVKERLAAAFASRTQHEWSEIFARADCCVSPILSVDEALENEQLRARGMVISKEGLTQVASPVKFSEFEFAIERPAPGSGEHTDEVLREAGFRDAEIAALRRNAVI